MPARTLDNKYLRVQKDGTKTETIPYTEEEFADHYMRLNKGNVKSMKLDVKQRLSSITGSDGNKAVIGYILTLSDEPLQTAEDVRKEIVKYSPSTNPLIVNFVQAAPTSGLNIANIKQAFHDVTRSVHMHNIDKYSTVKAAEEALIAQLELEFGLSETKVEFDGSLFGKIVTAYIKAKSLPDSSPMERARNRAKFLLMVQNNDSDAKDFILAERRSGERVLEPYLKASQWSNFVEDSKNYYYAYTPATRDSEAEVRFSSFESGKKPGRNGKLEGVVGPVKYIEYAQLENLPLYDRTLSSSGKHFVVAQSKAAATAKVADSDGFVTRSRATPTAVELTADQRALVETYLKLATSMGLKPPKSEAGLLKKALEYQSNGGKL